MELSDEQKQRILEEERQRLAEEQYRTQVRRDLQSRTVGAGSVPSKSSSLKICLIGVGIVALLCAGILIVRRQSSEQAASGPSNSASGAQERDGEWSRPNGSG